MSPEDTRRRPDGSVLDRHDIPSALQATSPTGRISAALAIDLNTRDEGAIEEFLTPDLHRQRHCGPVTEPFGTDWTSTVYEALRGAARDEPWDQSALDRVFEAYRTGEHGFRTAFEDFHRLHKFNWFVLPSLVNLVFEGLAIAHRRSGPWA